METSKAPAFFSYAREDSSLALRIASDLKSAGTNVWLDQLDIRPGQQWDLQVEKALNACDEMLVILSPTSVDSRNVMDEISFALEESKTVIPLLTEDCRIPFRLRRLQYVDFRLGYDRAIDSVVKTLAGQHQTDAGVATPTSVIPVPVAAADLNIEQEHIGREEAKTARKAEEQRIAQEKAEAARKAEEQRIAREKAGAIPNAVPSCTNRSKELADAGMSTSSLFGSIPTPPHTRRTWMFWAGIGSSVLVLGLWWLTSGRLAAPERSQREIGNDAAHPEPESLKSRESDKGTEPAKPESESSPPRQIVNKRQTSGSRVTR